MTILFISNNILMKKVEDSKLMFMFWHKILNFTLHELLFDSLDVIPTLISLFNPLKSSIILKKILIRYYSGSLLKRSSNLNSSLDLSIYDSILTLNSTKTHFIEIQNNCYIKIQDTCFRLSILHKTSALYLYGNTESSLIHMNKTEFISINKKSDFYTQEKSDSLYSLIQLKDKIKDLFIKFTTISIGIKNIRSLIDIYFYQEAKIISSYFYRNYLNQLSSLFTLGLCNKCRFFIQETRVEENRVAHGGFVNFLYLEGELDFKTIDQVIFYLGPNNTIRKNSVSLQGGHFFLNASLHLSLNFSSEFAQLLDKFFYIEQSNVFDYTTTIITFFIETNADNLINIRNNFKHLDEFLRFRFKNFFRAVLIRSTVTSYKIVSQNKISNINVTNSVVSLSEEVINNKSIPNIYHFCITLSDVLGRFIVSEFETDLYPSLYNETALEYLSIHSIDVHFNYIRGAYCAHKFELQGDDYIALMGKKLSFSVTPKVMKKVFPDLINESDAVSYEIVFLVHDCNPGELYKENQCVPCPRHSFLNEKVIGTLNKCIECTDFDYYFCYGGNMRAPKTNFWRISSDSDKFLRCPSSSCLGDPYFLKNLTENDCVNCYLPGSNKELLFYSFDKNVNALGFCKFGYKGNLCSECIEGYGLGNDYKCTDCSDYKPYIKQAIVALINFILFYYTCWDSIKNNTSSSSHDRNSKEFVNNTLSSYLLSIFFIYLSVIGVLKNIPYGMGELIEDFIKYFYEIAPTESLEFFSFKCLLDKSRTRIAPVFFQILMNFVFFGFSCLILMIMFFLQIKNIPNRKLLSLIPNIKGIFLIFFMNNLIRFLAPSFRILICIDLADRGIEKNVMLADLSLECNESLHKIFRYFVSLPLILTFGLGIPLLLMYKLFRSKNLSNNKEFLLIYGYFISPFRKEAFYFEIFNILHKLIIINFRELFIFLILTNNQPIAPGLLLCYLLLKYNLYKFLSPFDQKNYVKLHNMSLLSLKTNISNSLAALLWTLLETQLNSNYTKLLLIVYVGVSNLLFFLIWGGIFVRTKKESILKNQRVKEIFMKVSEFLNFKKEPNHYPLPPDEKILNNPYETSKKKLIKENNRLKILIKLLVLQIEYANDALSLAEGIDEGKTNYLVDNNRFFKIKQPHVDVLQESNMGISQRLDIPSVPKINKTVVKKRNWKAKPVISTSQELVSRKLKGSKFYDFFLQLKYRLLDDRADSKEERNLTADLFVDAQIINMKGGLYIDWVATVSSKSDKSNTFYINLRKFTPWINKPHSEILKIEFKNHSYKTTVDAEVFLQDFIKVVSLDWNKSIPKVILEDQLNDTQNIDQKIIQKLFKNEFKDCFAIEGSLVLSTPFIVNNQRFTVVFKKEGTLKILGNFFAKDLATLHKLLADYLDLQTI